MAVERANPLPPNVRYWVDVSPEDRPAFTDWLNRNRGAVSVVATSRSDGWDWVLFDVAAPLVVWEGPGFPTIAPPGAMSERDVKQIPTIETPDAGDVVDHMVTRALVGVGAILLAAVIVNRVLR